jgi:hypothetical protein
VCDSSKAVDTEETIIVNSDAKEEEENVNSEKEVGLGQDVIRKETGLDDKKISRKKLYKKAFVSIMEENGNKMKIKKLKKKVLEKSLEFDQEGQC